MYTVTHTLTCTQTQTQTHTHTHTKTHTHAHTLISVLTHGGGGGGAEAALAEGAQQGGLSHAGVPHQHHLEQTLRDRHGPLPHRLTPGRRGQETGTKGTGDEGDRGRGQETWTGTGTKGTGDKDGNEGDRRQGREQKREHKLQCNIKYEW